MKNPSIIAVTGGFYFFGDLVSMDEKYVALASYAMFGGFSGGKGLAGVARGDKEAKVTLDRFASDSEGIFPIRGVLAIMPSIDLYTSQNTTLR